MRKQPTFKTFYGIWVSVQKFWYGKGEAIEKTRLLKFEMRFLAYSQTLCLTTVLLCRSAMTGHTNSIVAFNYRPDYMTKCRVRVWMPPINLSPLLNTICLALKDKNNKYNA